MDIQTENYQLKWHSFGSYLSGCIASACNGADNFSDVALMTMDGRQILAHRFILSACSVYLNQVLKLHQTRAAAMAAAGTTTQLSIVLPPEITYKTLKVLVQYMYSGETTVSQDILESVLRGGDLLKVKGLWRPKEDQHEPQDRPPAGYPPPQPQLHQQPTPMATEERRHERRNSKVLSTSSRHSSRSNTSTPANSTCSTPVLQPQHNNSVIKESRASYANDKVTDNSRHHHHHYEQRREKAAASPSSPTPPPLKRQKNEESVIKTTQPTPPPLAPIHLRNKQNDSKHKARDEKDKEREATSKDLMQILVIKEEPIEWTEVNQEEIELVEREEIFDSEMLIKPEIHMDDADDSQENLYTPLTCELCSETFKLPADWVKHVQTHTDMMPAKRQKRGRPSNDEDNANFPPLQCDMCQEFFPTPAKWVQHIQHAHTEQEMQAANKTTGGRSGGGGGGSGRSNSARSSASSGGSGGSGGRQHFTGNATAATSATTAVTTGGSPTTPKGGAASQHKVCAVCNKKFPSHASMIIHRRTHTGERPYMCDYCCKGFNVKSNLLRHLRTLHDKCVNPTDIECKDNEDVDVQA